MGIVVAHIKLGSYQQLCNWTQDLLTKIEVISGTRKLANYPRPVNSFILNENPQATVY